MSEQKITTTQRIGLALQRNAMQQVREEARRRAEALRRRLAGLSAGLDLDVLAVGAAAEGEKGAQPPERPPPGRHA